VLIRFLQYNNY